MKIYTKTGDEGTTSLLSGERTAKDSLRVKAYGAVDEVTSAFGLARAACISEPVRTAILDVQKMLMLLMAELASTDGAVYIKEEHITGLEQSIDKFSDQLPPLREFIIPGGKLGAAALDMARTATRRAEREVLSLAREEKVNHEVEICLNRISDLCFVLERSELVMKA
ncbi:MAG: cob(I)yrinic acid a,c-diamide adenosyltransferase [Pelosinus sp.]|nr:cob(I)yrinic acid a,c-diamide adenosyltransferase [Pelosinus sp.]